VAAGMSATAEAMRGLTDQVIVLEGRAASLRARC